MTSSIDSTTRPRGLTRNLGRGALVVAVVTALLTGGSGAAWAWWSATSSVSSTVTTTTGTVPAPSVLGCTNGAAGENWARVSWTPVDTALNPVPSGATRGYRVTVTMANGATAQSTVNDAGPNLLQLQYGTEVPNNGQGGGFMVTVQTVYTFPSGAVATSAVLGPIAGHLDGNGNNRAVRCGR